MSGPKPQAPLNPPPTPSEKLKTRAGRRALIGKTLDHALELAKGYGVAVAHPGEIVLRLDERGRVKDVR